MNAGASWRVPERKSCVSNAEYVAIPISQELKIVRNSDSDVNEEPCIWKVKERQKVRYI